MAYRYRQEIVETGNVVEASWWNANQAELASEFNGGLDRDNFGVAAFNTDHVESETFTKVTAVDMGSDTFTADTETTDWQWEDADAELGNVDLVVEHDCVAIVEWSGQLVWEGGATDQSFVGAVYSEDAAEFRITVAGTTIATTGPVGDQRWHDTMYLCGAVPLPPGTHNVRVWMRVANRNFNGLSVKTTAINSVDVTYGVLLITERRR